VADSSDTTKRCSLHIKETMHVQSSNFKATSALPKMHKL